MHTEHLDISFTSDGKTCHCSVELRGTKAAWQATAAISGHPSIQEMHISYRLGDFLLPMFGSKETLHFFDPLLEKIGEQAQTLLPDDVNI